MVHNNSFLLSLGSHLLFVLIIGGLYFGPFKMKQKSKPIEFTIYQKEEVPKVATPIKEIPAVKPKLEQPQVKQKAVFGVTRKALVSSAESANPVEVKQGNTVAKVQDNEILQADDPDSLPSPTDEFLVSSMPVLKSEIRIPYPVEAREAGIQGPVVMELLIDSEGTVRKVELISGPGYGLNEAALKAIQSFVFIPAKVEGTPVAVKIRYTYRFVLETR